MAKTIKEERLRWVLPIIKGQVRLVDAARVCSYSKRSLERWVAAYRLHGESGLKPRSTEPKRYRTETPIWLREKIVSIRKRTRKCAKKICWQLKASGIIIHPRTVGKILRKEHLTRRYRVRKIRYKYIRAERMPGELVEIDVKYVPGKIAGKRYYQYTAIDTASRWRYMEIFGEQSNYHSVLFLDRVLCRFPYPIRAVKTDNGFVFTNRYDGTYRREDLSPKQLHFFDLFCARNNIDHYLIDPGKPAQNGRVERSHREDQEKFYDRNTFRDICDLKKKLRRWNIYYNNLEHCGLDGKTPNEFLKEYQVTNPPNVCT